MHSHNSGGCRTEFQQLFCHDKKMPSVPYATTQPFMQEWSAFLTPRQTATTGNSTLDIAFCKSAVILTHIWSLASILIRAIWTLHNWVTAAPQRHTSTIMALEIIWSTVLTRYHIFSPQRVPNEAGKIELLHVVFSRPFFNTEAAVSRSDGLLECSCRINWMTSVICSFIHQSTTHLSAFKHSYLRPLAA